MRYVARIAGVTHTVELRENGHERQVELDSRALTVDWQRIGGSQPHEPGTRARPRNTSACWSAGIPTRPMRAFWTASLARPKGKNRPSRS